MPHKRARIFDALALLVVLVVIGIDQWTKALVVKNIPFGSEQPFPVFGHNLYFWHIHNTGAAFSMLAGEGGAVILSLLIVIAIAVVLTLYIRMLNTGPWFYKLIFGLILGGAIGNLIDRVVHHGYVVDFISFRIPEWHYEFAIFNIADACISVGVVLLFLCVLFSNRTAEKGDTLQDGDEQSSVEQPANGTTSPTNSTAH